MLRWNELKSAGIKVKAVCPGFTSTDLNDLGTRTVEEAAREPVRLALLDADGPTWNALQRGRSRSMVM